MLSAAKHLLFLIENKQKQILRSAQNDIAHECFRSLVSPMENSYGLVRIEGWHS